MNLCKVSAKWWEEWLKQPHKSVTVETRWDGDIPIWAAIIIVILIVK